MHFQTSSVGPFQSGTNNYAALKVWNLGWISNNLRFPSVPKKTKFLDKSSINIDILPIFLTTNLYLLSLFYNLCFLKNNNIDFWQ